MSKYPMCLKNMWEPFKTICMTIWAYVTLPFRVIWSFILYFKNRATISEEQLGSPDDRDGLVVRFKNILDHHSPTLNVNFYPCRHDEYRQALLDICEMLKVKVRKSKGGGK